jgi:hypothetical protein
VITEAVAVALRIATVETLGPVVVVMMADLDVNGIKNRVSGGSSGDSDYDCGRQQQKLQGQATINIMRQQ